MVRHRHPGARFALNALLHVAILFAALMALWLLIIQRIEQQALEGEFVSLVRNDLGAALEAADKASGGQFRRDLHPLLPLLEQLRPLVTGDDQTAANHNQMLLAVAFGFLAVVLVAFCTMAATMASLLPGGVGFMLADIAFENLVIFAIIGAVEIWFFLSIVQHYIPVKPSSLLTEVIADLKAAFPPSETG